MKNFGTNLKKLPWKYIGLLLTVIFFFSFCAILTYDSGHYLSYVSIFEGSSPASSWDIVRGPIFPLIIHCFNIFFGKTNTGLLVGFFIFYIIFAFTCYKTCQEITKHYKHQKIINTVAVCILAFNPLIFGYFHVLLTEFVAITLTMLNLLIAYKWIFVKTENKKSLILYALYFIASIIFCYHLKQSYIIISFAPPLTAAAISIIRNHKKENLIYRIATIVFSTIFLFISIASWSSILKAMGVNESTGRDTSSFLGKQLTLGYQIPYDNDGDQEVDQISTFDAINLVFKKFVDNPLQTLKIYLQNYCALSSMCKVVTSNGYDFHSTSQLTGLATYENTFIGYATYREEDNISPMTEEMSLRAEPYASAPNKSIFANLMDSLRIPNNLLFKISALFPLPTLITLLIFKKKDKRKKHNNLFYLNLLLLITSCAHMFISAGIGLIIDRYAIEIFVPSLLGLFGTITYIILIIKQGKKHVKRS